MSTSPVSACSTSDSVSEGRAELTSGRPGAGCGIFEECTKAGSVLEGIAAVVFVLGKSPKQGPQGVPFRILRLQISRAVTGRRGFWECGRVLIHPCSLCTFSFPLPIPPSSKIKQLVDDQVSSALHFPPEQPLIRNGATTPLQGEKVVLLN